MLILAIGAHFDDVELGCGGTIARHARNGDEVTIYVATNSGYSDYANRVIRKPEVARREGQSAADILGVKELICGGFPTNSLSFNDDLVCSILQLLEEKRFDMIFTHWVEDIHHDHRAVARASITAGRHVPRLLFYRSNYYDSEQVFRGNFYTDITETLKIKKEAIKAHESEYKRVGEKWLQFFMNQNQNDGQKIGVDYAECFEVLKYLN